MELFPKFIITSLKIAEIKYQTRKSWFKRNFLIIPPSPLTSSGFQLNFLVVNPFNISDYAALSYG